MNECTKRVSAAVCLFVVPILVLLPSQPCMSLPREAERATLTLTVGDWTRQWPPPLTPVCVSAQSRHFAASVHLLLCSALLFSSLLAALAGRHLDYFCPFTPLHSTLLYSTYYILHTTYTDILIHKHTLQTEHPDPPQSISPSLSLPPSPPPNLSSISISISPSPSPFLSLSLPSVCLLHLHAVSISVSIQDSCPRPIDSTCQLRTLTA